MSRKSKQTPNVISVSEKEAEDLKKGISGSNLTPRQKEIILTILSIYTWLSGLYHTKKLNIKRIKRLFGFQSEKSNKNASGHTNDSLEGEQGTSEPQDSHGNPPKGTPKNESSKTRGGHGKNGKDDFSGAQHSYHELEELKRGDTCPKCLRGKTYPVSPGTYIHFVGNPPVQATIHETQKLRCNACQAYFEATLDKEFKQRYHPSSDVSMALQRYSLGLPFYRLGQWQSSLGVPLPPSTQWDRCEHLANSLHPVYKKVLSIASEGELFHGDDTGNKILSEEKKKVWTTGVVSLVGPLKVLLFFTNKNQCGKSLEPLLSRRKSETKAIFMSDALPGNLPKGEKVIWAKCNVHSRRNFWDYKEEYPKMVGYVLFLFRRIYQNEARAIKKGLSPEERLKYHQKHSLPIMEKLRRWGLKNLYLKKIEPNEELGRALKYFFKHYPELTLFLRVPGVPLDNNIVERLLKVPILNRKNSYFYKTTLGAFVGDMIMSMIETCKAAGKNPFKYLLSIHENKEKVREAPDRWLPWNYEKTLEAMALP